MNPKPSTSSRNAVSTELEKGINAFNDVNRGLWGRSSWTFHSSRRLREQELGIRKLRELSEEDPAAAGRVIQAMIDSMRDKP